MTQRKRPKPEARKVAEFMEEFTGKPRKASVTLQSEAYMTAREEIGSAIAKATEKMSTSDFIRLMNWLERQAKRYKNLESTIEP